MLKFIRWTTNYGLANNQKAINMPKEISIMQILEGRTARIYLVGVVLKVAGYFG